MSEYHSPNRRHSEDCFYKYMSASVAKIALTNHTLRWSAPPLFNDPFDVPREIAAGIDPSDILNALVELLSNMIEGRSELPNGIRPSLSLLVNMLRQSEAADSKEEVIAFLKESKDELLPYHQAFAQLKDVWEAIISDFRILCLSSRKDSTSMWNHYADKYRGVVLEIACTDKHDSPWLVARKVGYPVNRPSLLTTEGWAKILTLNEEEAVKYIFDEYCYTKTYDWRYEEEWRVVSFRRPNDKGLYSDFKINPRDFNAIYFGTEIMDEDREEILDILKLDLSHMTAYNSTISSSRHFEFKKMNY